MKPQYIDSHAHLFYNDYHEDLDVVIVRAIEAGVEAVIAPGTDLETSQEVVQFSDQHPEIYACVGYHPHEASRANEKELVEIEELSKHRKVVAIGEIGLDYHYNFSPREKQIEVFNHQIEIAVRRNLPIVIHMRESAADTYSIIEKVVQKNSNWLPNTPTPRRGVFHCFPGTAEEASHLRTLGFWVSYTGIVTFNQSSCIDIVKKIGIPNILLETDSPYMTPVPFRGKRNEPANIIYIGQKIAEATGINEEEIALTTTANAKALFGLK